MTKRVYLFKPVDGFDISDANRFGEIVYIYPNGDHPSIWDSEFSEKVLDELYRLRYNARTDYLALTGKAIPLILTLIGVAQEYEEFNLLLWDSTVRGYVLKTIVDRVNNVKAITEDVQTSQGISQSDVCGQ